MSFKTVAAMWSLACALACAPTLSEAQDKRVFAPGSTVPLTGMSFGGIGDAATPVTSATPLPVICITGCSGGGGGGTSGSASGFVAIPACTSTPLTTPTKGVVVSSAGNLGLRLSDGTNNDSQVIPVVAGQVFPFRAVCRSAANTAGVLGLN